MTEFSRRDFIAKISLGVTGTALRPIGWHHSKVQIEKKATEEYSFTFSNFDKEVELLPEENPYDYHKRLSEGSIHFWRRNTRLEPSSSEIQIPDEGWSIICSENASTPLKTAINDFVDYFKISMDVSIKLQRSKSEKNWRKAENCFIIGTKQDLTGWGLSLNKSKSYEIEFQKSKIVICGYDDLGAAFGVYYIQQKLNQREAPYLPKNSKIERESLYETRLVLSWMGWREWPDKLLNYLVHDGFDGIFASVYANPNGDRMTADNSTDFYARILYNVRHQDPEYIRDLINRASRFGIKIYTPIIWQYLDTPESELQLRLLVTDIVRQFPQIKGFVLLTEGFWYKKWRAGHDEGKSYMENWARNWCKAVAIVEDACHKLNPSIDILPWEYNIDFRPQNIGIKEYFIQQLPNRTTPLLTWENGKSFMLDGMRGYLKDYSLNQVGPAEVTRAQIKVAKQRGMHVFSKVDTFASWQFGTSPYLPCPYQWFERYEALRAHDINGTLESWSSGYKPNLMSSIRAWTCWSNAPSRDELFISKASEFFGKEQVNQVIEAWRLFSDAIRLVPDTGPSMGTNNAVGNPIFFNEPPLRTLTFNHSWSDPSKELSVNPYWPFTVSRMVFYPDFTNVVNKAEIYARSVTGVVVKEGETILPAFLKRLQMSIDKMEEGLAYYRAAALASPKSKRIMAVKEVIVAEQMQRMLESNYAILHFEDLRLNLEKKESTISKKAILDEMEKIIIMEIERTERSLLAMKKDSRLGFQFEQDYVYTPYSLSEKLNILRDTLVNQIPERKLRLV